jgi:hypothetical protein
MENNKNNKKTLYAILLLLLIVLLVAGYFIFMKRRPVTEPKIKVTNTSEDISKPGVYEDEVIKLAYPEGWKKQEVADPVKTAILNKKNYTVVVATNYLTAGNVDPGKLSELIAVVAPWLPQETAFDCRDYLTDETKTLNNNIKLHNLYFSTGSASADVKKKCGNPSMGGVLWYGSYFEQNGEYFIGPDLTHQIFAAVVYHTDSADKLPYKGDANLATILNEATEMVKNIEYKK